jgi:hypothetical protein
MKVEENIFFFVFSNEKGSGQNTFTILALHNNEIKIESFDNWKEIEA